MGDCRQPCKIFIGGLSFETTDDTLRAYFSRFGVVTDAIVMKDSVSRRSRGFGFITYADAASVDEALVHDDHVIDHRRVEAKRAVPRTDPSTPGAAKTQSEAAPSYTYPGSPASLGLGPDSMAARHRHLVGHDARQLSGCSSLSGDGSASAMESSGCGAMAARGGSSGAGGASSSSAALIGSSSIGTNPHVGTNKVFVGGLHYETRDGDFRAYFERFGRVLSAEVMFNRETHKSRGFGFVVFEAPESAAAVLQSTHHTINGKLVEVKAAVPRTATAGSTASNGSTGSGGGGSTSYASAASAAAAAAAAAKLSGVKRMAALPGAKMMIGTPTSGVRGIRSPLESPHKLSPTHNRGVVHHYHHHHHHIAPSGARGAQGSSSYAAALRYGGQPPPQQPQLHSGGAPSYSGGGEAAFFRAQHSPVFRSHEESLNSPASTGGAESGGAGRGTPCRADSSSRDHPWGLDPLALGSGGLEQYATPRGNRSGSAASSQHASASGGVFSPYQLPLDAPLMEGADLSPFFQSQPAPGAATSSAGGYLDAAMAGIAELRLNGSGLGHAELRQSSAGDSSGTVSGAASVVGDTATAPGSPPQYLGGGGGGSGAGSGNKPAAAAAADVFPSATVWSTLFGPTVSLSNGHLGMSSSDADSSAGNADVAFPSPEPRAAFQGRSRLPGLSESPDLGCASSASFLHASSSATDANGVPMNAPLDRAPQQLTAAAVPSSRHLGLFF